MRVLHFCNVFIIWFYGILFSHFRCSQRNCKNSNKHCQKQNNRPWKPFLFHNRTGTDCLTAFYIRGICFFSFFCRFRFLFHRCSALYAKFCIIWQFPSTIFTKHDQSPFRIYFFYSITLLVLFVNPTSYNSYKKALVSLPTRKTGANDCICSRCMVYF